MTWTTGSDTEVKILISIPDKGQLPIDDFDLYCSLVINDKVGDSVVSIFRNATFYCNIGLKHQKHWMWLV